MIQVYQLTKRHLDGAKSGDAQLDQIKVFSTCIGHGIGTIDFSEKIQDITDAEFEEILQYGGDYLKFKLGNLSKYFEIEIFPEHAARLLPQMLECPLKETLQKLTQGYLVLRKDF
jgi:hypothetical protein